MIEIIKLLGEEDAARLRKGIVELLLDRVKQDLDLFCTENYVMDFDKVLNDIYKEVAADTAERAKTQFSMRFEEKLKSMLEEMKI